MADKASELLKGAAESAQEVAEKMTNQARQYGEQAEEAIKEFKPFVERCLKATLAGAAIVGFILVALWKN